MKKRLLYSVLLSILLFSCDIENSGSDVYYYLNDYTKRIADFKEGSYWIYYCDLLFTYDTVTVVKHEKRQSSEHMDSHYLYYENIELTYNSTFWDCEIYDIISADYYRGDYYTRQLFVNDSLNRNFNIAVTNTSISPEFGGSVEIEEGIRLNGEYISHIVCYTKNPDSQISDKYYFADSYGIVKMEYVIDSVCYKWDLVEYKLVK
ncbi:MAG: hypothetical protein JXA77_10680 [Bacteroidales bacterium]|nr:hypothetical protein [Bacteroidales bacterium]MBN2820540.1 hypothetical protein [Bacteroidales bacterium]